mgnify:FL=1
MPKQKKKKKDTLTGNPFKEDRKKFPNRYTAEVTMTRNMEIDFYSSTPQQAKKDAMQLAQDDDWNSFDDTEVYGVKWVKAQKKKKKKK